MWINWLSPTFNLRFLHSLENNLSLGLGFNLTLSFFGINLNPSPGAHNLFAVTDGTLAPYVIIGHNNLSFHLGYNFVFGALYLSPNFMLTERFMLGIPVSLFGSNRNGTIASLMMPPRERVNPPTEFSTRSYFSIGISFQYVF